MNDDKYRQLRKGPTDRKYLSGSMIVNELHLRKVIRHAEDVPTPQPTILESPNVFSPYANRNFSSTNVCGSYYHTLLKGHRNVVASLCFTNDGKRIVSAHRKRNMSMNR